MKYVAYLKKYVRILYVSSSQVSVIIKASKFICGFPIVGKIISIILDNLLLYFYGLETSSRTLRIKNLIVGHSTGVVLGGNGIQCTGTLHISSGVVFARRYLEESEALELNRNSFFDLKGDVTIGSNTVLLGPLIINGPVIIGAMSLITKDILEPGVYVGIPAKKIKDLP